MMEILIPVICILVGLAILNFPIYIAILAATLYLQVFVNKMPLQNLFVGFFESLTIQSLMAIPFFILAGNLMGVSSLGSRLINLLDALLHRIRGGLAFSCLGANAFFGAISGSAPAATATFGRIIYKALEQEYGEKLATGLITSSGALSTIIPPSIIMIIFGVVTETSIPQLFASGLIPGFPAVLVVGAYLFVKGKRIGQEAENRPRETLGKAFLRAIPVLVLPFGILGAIYAGVATPTEAAGLSVLYAAVLSILIFREVKFSQIVSVLKDSVRTTAQIFILIASSTVFAQAVTIAQLPRYITQYFNSYSTGEFLLFLVILLLIAGCFFEPGAAILILAPLLYPTAVNLGIHPVHLGMIFVFAMSIGMFTPPFGLNIFVAQSIFRKPVGVIYSSLVPYIVLYILVLFVIAFIPELSLVIPQALF